MGLIGENHTYSYSQLQSVSECPYCYYLEKIERVNQDSNAFAEQGTLIHDLIDLWAKGKVSRENLVSEYERRYPNEVTTMFPRMLASKGYTQKAYEIGIEYFKNFDCFNGYKIIGTEEKFTTDLFGRRFVGIIDMVMTDPNDKLIVLDHKSKSLSAFKKAEDEMYRQQLLYSKYVKEKYGKYPDMLMFNLFKENGMKMNRDFSKKDYDDAMSWAQSMILKIENNELLDWLECKEPDFFCNEICSVRKNCPNGKIKPKVKKKNKNESD